VINQSSWGNYALPIWVETVTLTTVGYGDVVPETLFGRMFVIACCILGPAIISFSIISLVNFSQFTYSESLVQ
jgi:voltage-gated potassium channel Kch